MPNIFMMWVIGLFTGAAIYEFSVSNPVKGTFYLLSALININVALMK